MTEISSSTRRVKWPTLIVCGSLLLLFAVLAWSAARTKSSTIDEPPHALAGWLWAHERDYRMDPEDPPLWGYWMTLSNGRDAIHLDLSSPDWKSIPQLHWTVNPWWRETLFDLSVNNFEAVVVRARVMAVIIGVALGFLTLGWAYKLDGAPAAVVAGALFAFDPNFLAHAPLVKNDVAISLFMLATMYAVWRYGRSPTLFHTALIGVGCGAAMSTKFSGVLLVPFAASMILFVNLRHPGGARVRRGLGIITGHVGLLLFISIATVWASYGFRFSACADDSGPMNSKLQLALTSRAVFLTEHPDRTPTAEDLASTPAPLSCRVIHWIGQQRLMPEAWVNGLLYTYHTSMIRPAYLLGEVSQTGWWYYFPLAFAFKTPLATLVMIAFLAAYFGARLVKRTKLESSWNWCCLLLFPALYFAMAMRTNLNLGIRHVLPIYPPIFIASGVVFAHWWHRHRRAATGVAIVLVLALVVESVSAWPNYIPFFNVAARSYHDRLALLGDSNLDWGQDLKSLAAWRRQHPRKPLYLHYFGNASPAAYSLDFIPLSISRGEDGGVNWPEGEGVVAISATHLQGIYLPPDRRDIYRRLWNVRPLEIIGGSIFVFDLVDIRAAFAQTGR